MKIRNQQILNILALIIFLLSSASASFAKEQPQSKMPKNTWGTYHGFTFGCVRDYQTYEKCKTDLVVDASGITIGEYVQGLQFRVKYPDSWILTKKEVSGPSGVYEVGFESYAIRRSADSNEPRFWVEFTRAHASDDPTVTVLQDDNESPIGMYSTADIKQQSSLESQYEDMRKAHANNVSRYQLNRVRRKFDMDGARQIMKTGSKTEKLQTVVDAAQSINNDLSSEQVSERFQVFIMALADNDRDVQIHAIEPFKNWGRAIQAVPTLVSAIENVVHGDIHLYPDTRSELVQMVTFFYYDAFRYLHRDATLRKAFGTTELTEIHARTKGLISATQLELLAKAEEKFPPRMQWTTNELLQLRETLNKIIAHQKLFSPEDHAEAVAILAEYDEPFGDCVGSLKGH